MSLRKVFRLLGLYDRESENQLREIGRRREELAKLGDYQLKSAARGLRATGARDERTMKILASDGYLKPKFQVVAGIVLCVWFFAEGIASVVHARNNLDIFFGVMFLCGSPG